MFDIGLILLIVVAIGIGWFLGQRERISREAKYDEIKKATGSVPKEYFQGLNFLLNEQPDQAVDLFAKTIDVTADTVEIYLSLGTNFRQRGEVDRAIKIHQDLLARPNLEKRPSADIQLALGQDYLAAGLLDRAERLLVDLIDNIEAHQVTASLLLVSLYEQEQEWQKAIDRASLVPSSENSDIHKAMAHYQCELATAYLESGDWGAARESLQKALFAHNGCVRASLMFADLEIRNNQHAVALQHLHRVREQDPSYVSESVDSLVLCYRALNREDELNQYLDECLKSNADDILSIRYGDFVETIYGVDKAIAVMSAYMLRNPSLSVLSWLLSRQNASTTVKMEQYWNTLKILAAHFVKKSARYHCSTCGFNGNSLHWSCPSCKSWVGYKPSSLAEQPTQ